MDTVRMDAGRIEPVSTTRWPAEWEPKDALLLTWPENRETWPGERLKRVEAVYVELLRTMASRQRVLCLVSSAVVGEYADRLVRQSIDLGTSLDLEWIVMPTNDLWVRDYGPIGVLEGDQPVWLDWTYNAWGGKYPPFDLDHAIPKTLAGSLDVTVQSYETVLEGGAIEGNGDGLLLTTKAVLQSPARNPGVSQHRLDQILQEAFGVSHVCWFDAGLKGDDTDGHVDDFARFVRKDVVLMAQDTPGGPNEQVLRENKETLTRFGQDLRAQQGFDLNIIDLPMPRCEIEGTTVDGSSIVPASYANFVFGDNTVYLPLYDPKTDREAIAIFQDILPELEIVGIQCHDLVWGQGSIHCVTQNLIGLSE